MSESIDGVVEAGGLAGEAAGLFIKISSQTIGVNISFVHGNVSVLIGMGVGGSQCGNEKTGKACRIRLLAAACRGDDDPSFCGEALDELTTRARHVEYD